ncbi:MAG: hypothetical protein WBA12_07170 [Catalinimonas sp.]
MKQREKQHLLDQLFAQLRTATDTSEAGEIERQIWHLWMESGDEHQSRQLRHGFELMRWGLHDEACRVFTGVIKALPDLAEGWNKRATAHYLRGHYKASIEDIEETLRREPRHFGALSGWAMICRQLGDRAGELRALRALYALCPQQQDVQRRIDHLEDEAT